MKLADLTKSVPEAPTNVRLPIELSTPVHCKCGGKAFQPVHHFRHLSEVVSPTGKELFIGLDGMICTSCKTFYYGPEELKGGRKSEG